MQDARGAEVSALRLNFLPATQGLRSISDLAISLGGWQAILELGAFSRRSQHGRPGSGLVKVYKTYINEVYCHVSILSLNSTDPEHPC